MIWNFIRQAQRRQRERDELRGMSDRDLADIGIGRSEVPAVLALRDAPLPASPQPPATSRETGARTAGSPAVFRCGLSTSGAACRLHRA